MKSQVDVLLYGLLCMASVWLVLLWVSSQCAAGRRCSLLTKLAAGAAAALLPFVPVGELPLWKFAFSLWPNPSLPLLAIICTALWQQLTGRRILSGGDWHTVWAFGAVAGSLLYLHGFWSPVPDLYFWGWNHELAVWTIAGLAVCFLCWGNRLGVMLIAALAMYELQALESENGWDYIIDPFYWMLGCGVCAGRGGMYLFELMRRSRAISVATAAAGAVPAEPLESENS